MKTIYKYPVLLQDHFLITMPEGSDILTVQVQDGEPFIWARVDTDAKPRIFKFYLCGTGNPFLIPDNQVIQYVGTFQRGWFVGHLYRVV